MSDNKKLTTSAGCPVADNQNVMTAGPRGPQLLQDVWFLEKLAHFDREVIPERRIKGAADALGLTFSDVSPEDVESTTVVRGHAFPEAIQKAVSIIN